MPALNQLRCTIERDPKNIALNEYNTTYGNGYVETFVAVPGPKEGLPDTFSVHLTSSGYIAPGLAMFVYVDGVVQCNRNRRGLKMPGAEVDPWEYEIDFRVRQKETKLGDGKYIVHLWSWAKLNTTTDDTDFRLDDDVLNSIGTIEVVILRCEFLPEWGYVVPEKPVTKLGLQGWDAKKAKEQRRLHGSQDCWEAGSEVDSVAFGMFDGTSEAKSKTIAKEPRIYSLDGPYEDNEDEHTAPTWSVSAGDDPRRYEGPGTPLAMPYSPHWMMPGYNPYPGYPAPSMAPPWYPPPHGYPHASPWRVGSGTYKRGKVAIVDGRTDNKAAEQGNDRRRDDNQATAGWQENKATGSSPGDAKWGATTGDVAASGNWDTAPPGNAGWDNPAKDNTEAAGSTSAHGGWDNPAENNTEAAGSTSAHGGWTTTETAAATGGDAANDTGNPWVQGSGTWANETKEVREKHKTGEQSQKRTKKIRESTNNDADKQKPIDPDRPHVKSYWVSEKPKADSNSVYIAPAPSVPQVPMKHAEDKGLTHQVQPGRGWIWEHRRCKPKYIDSLQKPYAVFAFKYRSKEALEKMLSIDVKRSKEDYRTRMRRLTKEEVIEQLMKTKDKAGYNDDSSVSSRTRTGSSGGTSVVTDPSIAQQEKKRVEKADARNTDTKSEKRNEKGDGKGVGQVGNWANDVKKVATAPDEGPSPVGGW